ncbi:MAG: hypothetical protein QNJ30_19650 [Kiloniellales bacterium]|nr:hypothetical protein [Kiloniellales bacterium]
MSKTAPQEISIPKRMLFGGLGGIVPVLIAAAALDPPNIHVNYMIGSGFKALVMFALGAIVPFLMSDIKNPKALIMLGMVAPSIYSNATNTIGQINERPPEFAGELTGTAKGILGSGQVSLWPSPGRALAGERSDGVTSTVTPEQIQLTNPGVRLVSLCWEVPRMEGVDSFVRGLLGLGNPTPKFFIVVGRFRSNDGDKADKNVTNLNTVFEKRKILDAFALKIEDPFEGSRKDWYVLVGHKGTRDRLRPRFISPLTRQVIFDTQQQAEEIYKKVAAVITEPPKGGLMQHCTSRQPMVSRDEQIPSSSGR